MAPAMLCKKSKKNKHGETRSKSNDFKGVAHRGFHVVAPRVQFFFEALLFCLAHALSSRCLLSSRLDTASIRSCLLFAIGIL